MIYTNRASKTENHIQIFSCSFSNCNVLKLDRSLDQVINRKNLIFSEGRALRIIE